MTKEASEFILYRINMIRSREFEKFFDIAMDMLNHPLVTQITHYLWSKNIDFINYMSYIPLTCFANENFTSFVIPESIKIIMTNAFTRCNQLRSIVIPSNVLSIHNHAFSYCTGLEKIEIRSYDVQFGYECFKNCDKNLKSLIIPRRYMSSVETLFDVNGFVDLSNVDIQYI